MEHAIQSSMEMHADEFEFDLLIDTHSHSQALETAACCWHSERGQHLS